MTEFFYLLSSPGGQPLVGNLLEWPQEVDARGYHAFRTQVASTGSPSRERGVVARAIVLPEGFRLLVGNISDDREVLRVGYLWALVWSLLATGLIGLALGFWYSRRGLAFVEAAAESGERFLGGSFGERLPVSTRGDEYDRLAEAINRSFEEVERLVGSLRAATEGLAHDLKTPLTRIRARLEVAEIEHSEAEQLQTAMAESKHDLHVLLQLIDDVLHLARAEATAADSLVQVQLAAIVSDALELFQPLAEERAVQLRSDLETVSVVGARSLLAQATANLIDNAVKYTPPGGLVTVTLTRGRDDVRLTVADSGPGIPEELREQATYRFARLDPSRSQPGSGIGLSIVAAAARVHHGSLRLGDNNPGLIVELILPHSCKVALRARCASDG